MTTLSPEDAVWQSVSEGAQALAALEAPDPNAPVLAQYFTGDSLALLQQAMTDDLAGNTTRQSTIELHRYSVTVGGDTADVDYCFIDTTQLFAGGQWKVASETREEEQCPAG